MVALPEMGKEAATEMMRVAIATGEVNKIRKQLEEGTIEVKVRKSGEMFLYKRETYLDEVRKLLESL